MLTPPSRMKIAWTEARREFVDDGALCDIQIVDATAADWQTVLDFIRSSAAELRFTVDGTPAMMPAKALSIIASRATVSPALLFRWGDIELATHFFGDDDLEFDFPPGNVRGQTQLDQLASFIFHVGRLLRKAILVYQEGWEMNPFFTYQPQTDDIVYSPQRI
jgi:hypothetical protein